MSDAELNTVGISETLSQKLDEISQMSGRSRSSIVEEALERYLDRRASRETPRNIMSFAGAGIHLSKRRTAEEIDAEIRWLRDDD